MKLETRKTSNGELHTRKDNAVAQLREATGMQSGTITDFESWANMGLMSPDERAIYDELKRILFLLGDA